MQLTQFTDYSLRTLLYLALKDGRATVAEIATSYKISRNHLVKVAHQLSRRGFIKSIKGKDGGLVLARPPAQIRIGDLVKEFEPNMDFVECFNAVTNKCPIIGVCGLERILHGARESFLATLNEYTLADLLSSKDAPARRKILGIT